MWITKLFQIKKPGKEENKPQSQLIQFQQEQIEESAIFIDQNLDVRYADIKIIKASKTLNIPLLLLQFTQTVAFHQVDVIQAKSEHNNQWCRINLIISDRQIIISPDIFSYAHRKNAANTNTLSVPFGIVEKVQMQETKKSQNKLIFTLKNSKVFMFRSVLADYLVEIQKLVKTFGFPQGINRLYAFKYGKIPKQKKKNGWEIYNFRREMQRQGVIKVGPDSKHQPRILAAYKIIDNTKGELSHTYPAQLIIPSKMSDNEIVKCSKFRTKQRLPSLTYFYQYKPNNYSTLFRCSQNKVGLMYARCNQDEKMIACISEATQLISSQPKITAPKLNCKIYDARGYYAALGNKLAGKGFQYEEYYNCQVEFLNIPNIHAVRDSYNRIKNYNPHSQEYIKVFAESEWPDFLFLILKGAKSITKTLRSGTNVVVHCSDGWDRTAQLCSLSQLLLDPYFRTFQGFFVLVEKDWRHFGHKFRQRTGQYNPKNYSIHQISPIFIQFLDCIYQIMHQFPLTFEFNHQLLAFLAQSTQSHTYGSFLTNNYQESRSIKLEESTISIWSDVMERKKEFMNLFYNLKLNTQVAYLDISVELQDMAIWRDHLFGEQLYNSTEEFVIQKQLEVNKRLKEQLEENRIRLKQVHNCA